MMKALRIIILLLVAVCSMQATAQTRAYKRLYVVDPNTNVREQCPAAGSYMYYTFTNGNSIVYGSDANGIKNGTPVYQFEGRNGEVNFYRPAEPMLRGMFWMSFSSDFSRLNMDYPGGKVLVLEYDPNPTQATGPSQMY